MDDHVLTDNDPDELPRPQTPERSDGRQAEDYFEKLEEELLEEAEKSDHKDMPVSGKSVFEIERLKRKRFEEDKEE